MSKPVLKSGRLDVRALDEVFVALFAIGHNAAVRVLRFYCESQGILPEHVWPERFK